MSSNNIINNWDRRNVDYDKIHGDSSEAYRALLSELKLSEGIEVADVMSGYGSVTKEVIDECLRLRVKPRFTLIDFSEFQIEKSREYLRLYEKLGYKISRIVGDARKSHFLRDSLDIAVMKMGLHEVPQHDQSVVLRNVFDSLKPNGKLYLWDSYGNDSETNEYFNMIVKQKDRLAGFDSMVTNRYFSTREEIVVMMTESGLKYVRQIYEGEFEYKTDKLSVDFQGDKTRLDELNEYIRTLVPPTVRRKIEYIDYGGCIDLRFSKGIFVGRK